MFNRWIEKETNSNNERRQQFYGFIPERQSRYRWSVYYRQRLANSEVNFKCSLGAVCVWLSALVSICFCTKFRFHLNFMHYFVVSFRFLHVIMRFKIYKTRRCTFNMLCTSSIKLSVTISLVLYHWRWIRCNSQNSNLHKENSESRNEWKPKSKNRVWN